MGALPCEIAARYIAEVAVGGCLFIDRQGKRIEASGVLTTRTYEKNGVKRKRTEVRCDQVFFGESKKDSGSRMLSSTWRGSSAR